MPNGCAPRACARRITYSRVVCDRLHICRQGSTRGLSTHGYRKSGLNLCGIWHPYSAANKGVADLSAAREICRGVQLLLGHAKVESRTWFDTSGIEVDDVLEMAEQTEDTASAGRRRLGSQSL